jgi:hypothetical protein
MEPRSTLAITRFSLAAPMAVPLIRVVIVDLLCCDSR